MHYPPRESMHSVDYLSAEEYQSRQEPQNGEAVEGSRPLPAIIVYANRIRSARILAGMTNMLLLYGMVVLLVIYAIAYFTNEGYTGQALLAFDLILLVSVLVLLRQIFVRWCRGRSLLVNAQPLLMIDSHGISIRGSYALDNIFLAWSEIEAIEHYHSRYHYLCICPRDPRLLARRAPLYERLLRLTDLTYKMPCLVLPSVYLDKPVEEILQQLYHIYAKELNYYQVQIRS
ncbi:MAG TPA: hypothetical protein VHD63_17165 [Ktedonobacteraceae bacterium]|nr:hypothetical protein [Ktedonobacteraceae bacterium]